MHLKYPIVLWAIFTLLAAAHAQAIQPEVLYVFPYGNSPRGPEFPDGNLVQDTDGSFYGTAMGGDKNLGSIFKLTASGQLSTVVSFNGTNGTSPQGGLVISSDGSFYGTTSQGGSTGNGTVFRVTADGILTTLVSFNGTNGAVPTAALTFGPDDNLYGTTYGGGQSYGGLSTGAGTVFKITTNGTLTSLVSFENDNGANPYAPLTLGPDGNFYGTTSSGGGNNHAGTVFRVTLDGGLTTLASFNGSNGESPRAALTLGLDGDFYGTTSQGGIGLGTIFKVTTNGVLTRLYSFNNITIGATLTAPLILGRDGNFYGTTYGGGANGYGTVFRVTANGLLTRLASFNNSNGLEPHAGLILGSDGNFYGTTVAGGGGGITGTGVGTLFRLTPAGGLTKLVSFGKPVGASPEAALTLGDDGYFYGTTSGGGSNDFGTVFKVTTKGSLEILASFNNVNGAYPVAALTLGNDGNFYGTTREGGSSRVGTVFKVTTNGTLTRLASFNNVNGAYPQAPLTFGTDGNFYGTTTLGGSSGFGTVFKVATSGVLTRLVSFNNTNGGTPVGALLLAGDGSFYGATSQSGGVKGGTVFRVTTSGILTTVASFVSADAHPQGGLILAPDGNFYGLTASGDPYGPGTLNGVATLFRVTTEGSLTMLGSFVDVNPGAWLLPALALGRDGNFYGTTSGGSSDAPGTVFQVTTNGTFSTLISFANTNGAVPTAPLTLGNDGNLYGTTAAGGGDEWAGTIFRINFQAPPVIFSQPQPANEIVRAGVTTSLSASVLGAPPLIAQWTFNDGILPGATNTWLTLKNVLPSMSGNYSLRVINSLGSTSSSNAVITVLPALLINLPVTGITGTSAVLNGSVTIGPNETLAWFEWGENTNYGQIDGFISVPGGKDTVRFSSALTDLHEGLIYHYRTVAWNNFGIVYGPDQAFQVGPAYAYAQSVLADEPLIYYRFEEESGAVALNSGFLGAAADGGYNADVLLGNQSLDPLLGYAAGFNNTNSGVAVPPLGSYSQITIEEWVNPRSFVGDASVGVFDSIYTTDNWVSGALHTHLISQYLGFPFESPHQYQFSINGNTPQWIDVGDSGLFRTNSWVHLAAAYDSVAREVISYVNGRPLATNMFTTAIPVNLTAAHIGEFTGSANWFDGAIDEFAIYGSALSAARIQAHYQAAIGNPVLRSQQTTNNLVFSWTGPGFRLERNADLSNGAGWSAVIAGSNSPVSVTISNSANQFFRLKLP